MKTINFNLVLARKQRSKIVCGGASRNYYLFDFSINYWNLTTKMPQINYRWDTSRLNKLTKLESNYSNLQISRRILKDQKENSWKSDKGKFNARLFSRSHSHEFIISTFKAKLEWKIFLSPWYSRAANENCENQLFFLLCFHPNSNSLSRLAHWFQTRHSIAVCFAKVTRHETEGERQKYLLMSMQNLIRFGIFKIEWDINVVLCLHLRITQCCMISCQFISKNLQITCLNFHPTATLIFCTCLAISVY